MTVCVYIYIEIYIYLCVCVCVRHDSLQSAPGANAAAQLLPATLTLQVEKVKWSNKALSQSAGGC